MAVRLYVVTDEKTDLDYLVAAKTRQSAMRYVAKSVLRQLSAVPATALDVLLSKKNSLGVLGEDDDLAAIGMGGE